MKTVTKTFEVPEGASDETKDQLIDRVKCAMISVLCEIEDDREDARSPEEKLGAIQEELTELLNWVQD